MKLLLVLVLAACGHGALCAPKPAAIGDGQPAKAASCEVRR